MTTTRYGWGLLYLFLAAILLMPFYWAVILIAVFLLGGIQSVTTAVKYGDFPWDKAKDTNRE